MLGSVYIYIYIYIYIIHKSTREVVLPRPYLFEKKEKDFYVCQSHPCVTDL